MRSLAFLKIELKHKYINSLIAIHIHKKKASAITTHISKVLTAANHVTRLMIESKSNSKFSLTNDKNAIKKKEYTS